MPTCSWSGEEESARITWSETTWTPACRGANDGRPAWAPEPAMDISVEQVSPAENGYNTALTIHAVVGYQSGFKTPEYFPPENERPNAEQDLVSRITVNRQVLPQDQWLVTSDARILLKPALVADPNVPTPAVCVSKRAGIADAPDITVSTNQAGGGGVFQSTEIPDVCPAQPIAFRVTAPGNTTSGFTIRP